MTKKKIAFLLVSSSVLMLFVGAALFGQVAPKDNIYRHLSVFTEVFSLTRSNYVEEIPTEQLVDGAFNGITDAVDEYSYYVPPQRMAEYRTHVEDEANRIGVVVTRRFGYLYVVAPVAGSPAEKAGIRPGDFIEKIDDRPTAKMPVWESRTLLARADAKPLRMTIVHGGLSKREQIEIKPAPANVALPKVQQYGNVAVVTIPFFGPGTSVAFRDLLDEQRKLGTRKLIVDVRGDAGGSVEEAVKSADLLLHGGVITTTSGRKVEAKRFEADQATSYDGDVEVLTDRSTASAAEIFAAAIHGNSRGKIVGLSSYGKAVIQKLIPLPSGGALYLTIGHYTTPDGRVIKDQGLEPDVVVDMTANILTSGGDDSKKTEPQDDLILKKALSLFGVEAQPKKIAA